MRFEAGRLSSIRKLAKTRVYWRCNKTRLNCAKRDHGDNCERLTRISVSPDVCQKGGFRWVRNARNYLKWPARKFDKNLSWPENIETHFSRFRHMIRVVVCRVHRENENTTLSATNIVWHTKKKKKIVVRGGNSSSSIFFSCNNRCSTLDRNTSRSTATPSTENACFRNTACGFVRLHENPRDHFDKSVVAWVDGSKEFQSEWMLNKATN